MLFRGKVEFVIIFYFKKEEAKLSSSLLEIPLRRLKVTILKWPICVADSTELAIIQNFLEESDTFEYIMYITD